MILAKALLTKLTDHEILELMKKIPYFHLILIFSFVLILIGYYKFSKGKTDLKQTATAEITTEERLKEKLPKAIWAAPVQAQAQTQEPGLIVVDAQGLPYYINKQESDGVSRCYDECAETWIPMTFAMEEDVITVPETHYSTDIIQRDDGTYQATYKGYPIYWYSGDAVPGDKNGQGIGNWELATIE